MFRFCLRLITRFRLIFMMGEEEDTVLRKIHGYNKVKCVNIHCLPRMEFEDPILYRHQECCCIWVNDKTIVLYCCNQSSLPSELQPKNINKVGDKLIVYRWKESY